LSIEKARRELGYAPRPIGGALEEAVQSILSKSQGRRTALQQVA
jgi:hypothetical protein